MAISKDTSPELYSMVKKYFDKYKSDDNHASVPESIRHNMVEELKAIYTKLSYKERMNALIPACEDFLAEVCIKRITNAYNQIIYDFIYIWPDRNYGRWSRFKGGRMFDRIGDTYGTYLCPMSELVSYSISQRSLPYFFLEEELEDINKCPSYHKYYLRHLSFYAKRRRTRPAFNQKGGAIEYMTRNNIIAMINSGKMEEIECVKK